MAHLLAKGIHILYKVEKMWYDVRNTVDVEHIRDIGDVLFDT